jgi:three-Cys-motif partner protein
MPRSSWPELCKTVEADDRLPTRAVGEWSEEKLYFWHQYIGITTNSMIGKPQWAAGLVYVDLFSGPGICTIRETGRRIPGSALIAANAPKPFAKILLAELDPTLAAACEARLRASPAAERFKMFVGDSNDRIAEIVREIPDRALTLAFIDPPGLDDKFATISALSRAGQVDLLVLFADAYDIVRNVDRYEEEFGSKLDRILGQTSNWREQWQALSNRSGANVRQLFAKIYCEQLRKLGYCQFGEKQIESRRGPMYRLIYASKHAKGLEFWNKVLTRDRKGQGGLF